MKTGQAISISAPDNNEVSAGAPSLSAKAPVVADLPSELRAPASYNSQDFTADFTAPPQAFVPAVSAAQSQRLKTMLDARNNWALETPEQILGVETPEKILNIPDRDAAGQQKNLTAVDRYYQRMNQTQADAFRAGDENNAGQSNQQDAEKNSRVDADIFNPANGRLGASGQILNQPTVAAPDNSILAGQGDESSWSKLFGSSQPSSAPDPAQLAAMNRFKQLLQPNASAAPTPADSSTYSPYAPRDYRHGQPAANQLAISFAPLSSGIGTPSGLSVRGGSQNNWKPPAPPAWAPKPAPWLSKKPQDFVVPKQIF
jgi:hypothetical protein